MQNQLKNKAKNSMLSFEEKLPKKKKVEVLNIIFEPIP